MANERDIRIRTPSSIEKASKQKWLILGLLAVCGIVLVTTVTNSNKEPRYVKKSQQKLIDTSPGDESKHINERIQVKLKDSELAIKNILAKQELLENKIEDQKAKMEELRTENSELKTKVEATDSKKSFEEFKMPPRSDKTRQKSKNSKKINGHDVGVVKTTTREPSSKVVPPPVPGKPYSANTFKVKTKTVDEKNVEIKKPKTMVFKSSANDDTSDKKSSSGSYKKNPFAGVLPPGSFAEVALLSGLDAGASENTRSNPQPIFMRVQNNATLPGNARYKLESCTILGVGYGDMSSERAYIQLSRITCVDKNSKTMLVGKLEGYLADSDGVLGLRGKVVRRSGAVLAKAMLAGFAEGATQLLSAAKNTIITGAEGATTILDSGAIPEAGMYSGASNAAKILAEQYIKEAKSIFPVVQVPAGRRATAMVTEIAQLEWKPYVGKYVKEITPEGAK